MLPKVDVLKIGYFRWIKKYKICRASCTITLVQEGKIKLVVDTGNEADKIKILAGLKKNKLTAGMITHVVNTHCHADHIGCNYLFKRAEIISAEEMHKKDRFRLYEGDLDLSNNIKIMATPGHTESDCTVLVKTNKAVIAIAGDIFWRSQYDKPAFFSNRAELNKSRRWILELSDYIIPGHDKMFKVC